MFRKGKPHYFVLIVLTALLLLSSASTLLATGPLEAHYVHYVPGMKTAVFNQLSLLGGQTTHEFDTVDALAVTLPTGAMDVLALNTAVSFHEPVPTHQPYTTGTDQIIPWSVEMLQAPDVWDADRDGVLDTNAPTGAGITVCIIDTGFHGSHEDLQGFTVAGSSQILGESWNEDGNGHGTHVAGTINAQNNGLGVVGVAPGQADIFIVKVFDNNGEWAIGQSNLGSAAETCHENGADIISMSLGGGSSTTEQQIFQSLYDNYNVLNVAAAGNDGDNANSYPANYPAVISVAALQESETVADFSQFPPTQNDPNNPPANIHWDTTELSAGGQDILSTWPYFIDHRVTVDGVTYSANRIDEAPFGQVVAPMIDGGLCLLASGSLDWRNKIVLCERGEVAFSEKVNEANLWDAAGVIIYNNAPGNFNGTCASNCVPNLLPAISLSQADGQYLVNNKLGQIGRIVSNESSGNNGYNTISGTSMATPAVSASAAVIWSACGGPAGISNKDLRQLLRDSARDLAGTRDAGGTYGAGYDDYTGFGLVQMADAWQLANGRFGESICPLDGTPTPPPPPPAPDYIATGWNLVKFPQGQPLCTGVGYNGMSYYDRLDCGFGYVVVDETVETDDVKVQFVDADGNVLAIEDTTYRSDDAAWEFSITPSADWSSGKITLRVSNVNSFSGNFGETSISVNQLGATIGATGSGYAPGDEVTATGTIFEIDQTLPTVTQQTPVAGTFYVRVYTPSAEVRGPFGPYTADFDGTFSITLPSAATAGVTADADSNFEAVLALEVVNASYDDLLTGEWSAERAGAGSVKVTSPSATVVLENSFVSSVGWVKPGETYPSRIFVKNFTANDITNAVVTIANVDGSTYTQETAVLGNATIIGDVTDSTISWNIGTVPAGSVATLVIEAQADDVVQDPQIVWKDISSTATLTYDGGDSQSVMSHGPKVIPPSATYDTARFGDRPFPVVPVDYTDRAHQANHTGDLLADKINNPEIVGSTYNLFQEMSLGQLHPNGTVPSAGIMTADFTVDWNGRYTDNQFSFSNNTPQGVCYGTQLGIAAGSPLYAERIIDGWYQLPGDTAYYGGDKYGPATLAGAVAGVGLLLDIDSACGPTGKAVYDAAHIADPEIDYNDYDTDKDGVVDFFMMVFAGCGGNGSSQLGPAGCDLDNNAPHDNIWPHSSSLEFYFTDAETGLQGYISDDQLRSLTDVPQCWLNTGYAAFDDCAAHGGNGLDNLPVFVRVGPYNVNPEDSIDNASVISHEYGHSLGLPDFYSLGSRETYGDWNLMATDKSHHMDVFAKQEMGWLIPQPIVEDTTIANWYDSKLDTGEIHWQQPDGTPYTLSTANGDQNVHNGEAYVVKLPAQQLIDPIKVAEGASLDHVWFSGSGNDYGCTPTGGHNLDIYLPDLANVDPGAEVIVSFKSYFDIEWDYDYGFVMFTHDGATYTSLPSEMGYTTPASQNPNQNACQGQYGNGLTGTSGSFSAGSQDLDRLLGEYPDGGFVVDRYDLSAAAGESTVLRLSYATDPGLARPGWFIDDLVITVDGVEIYNTDFEEEHDERLFPGGCNSHGATAQACTVGWNRVSASQGSTADHAYYLEMRDRSGFDFDGNGENDRGEISFQPGLLMVITDESHGYGNTGADNYPAQSPVDSRPEAGAEAPDLNDAAFKNGDSYSDFGATGWIDNYTNPEEADGNWHHAYDCLSFTVDNMVGHTTIGPNTVPGDLVGTVTFDLGEGCGVFDYGYD